MGFPVLSGRSTVICTVCPYNIPFLKSLDHRQINTSPVCKMNAYNAMAYISHLFSSAVGIYGEKIFFLCWLILVKGDGELQDAAVWPANERIRALQPRDRDARGDQGSRRQDHHEQGRSLIFVLADFMVFFLNLLLGVLSLENKKLFLVFFHFLPGVICLFG